MKIQRYGDKILGLWWLHISLTYETIARKWPKVIHNLHLCKLTKNRVFFSTKFFPFLLIWLRRFDKTPFMKIQRYGDKILGLWWPHIRLTYETIATKWTKVINSVVPMQIVKNLGFLFNKIVSIFVNMVDKIRQNSFYENSVIWW